MFELACSLPACTGVHGFPHTYTMVQKHAVSESDVFKLPTGHSDV